jgi:hypothetical protein
MVIAQEPEFNGIMMLSTTVMTKRTMEFKGSQVSTTVELTVVRLGSSDDVDDDRRPTTAYHDAG